MPTPSCMWATRASQGAKDICHGIFANRALICPVIGPGMTRARPPRDSISRLPALTAKVGACAVDCPTHVGTRPAPSQPNLPGPSDRGGPNGQPTRSTHELQARRKTASDNQTPAQQISELCFRAPRPLAGPETTSAKTSTCHPSLIALARLMGRQAARDWLTGGSEGGGDE